MTQLGCNINQRVATEAIDSIMAGEDTLWQLEDWRVSRVLVCGRCNAGRVDKRRAKLAFRQSFDKLADKVARYDEWGPDPELQQARSRRTKAKYREKYRDRIITKGRASRLDRRIAALRKRLGMDPNEEE